LIWPKISIVTPSFNQGRFIEQTILSVINQNYPNLEYIIIDGGSTDDTVSIIKKYEKHITYWVSEKDKGQSHAINKGIEKCTGEIFNWLNSDDWYEPDALFKIAKAFMNDSSLQFVSGFENHIYENGDKELHTGTYLNVNLIETIERCEVAQPSTFFKLSSIKRIGGVSNDLHYIMDGDMWIKLLLLYGQKCFKKIDEVLVNFRLHESSKTISNRNVNNFLYERCSIIIDLQKSIGVPKYIIHYFISDIYQSSKTISIGSNWMFNDKITTKKKLRIYFIKKYIIKQFIVRNNRNAQKGLFLLLKDKVFGIFMWVSFLKLLFKSSKN
jgi:glycosyltransferase involved in cell wall biosynthesis